jgi:hypothetical protein
LGRAYAAIATVTVGWLLYTIATILPVTQVYTVECRHEYFLEVIGPKAKPLLQKKGEILVEYTTNLVTLQSGKCQAPNKKAVALLKENVSRDLADYFLSNPQTLPSRQPTSTSAPATMP